jgi:mono/diheme cytochrome c family protein
VSLLSCIFAALSPILLAMFRRIFTITALVLAFFLPHSASAQENADALALRLNELSASVKEIGQILEQAQANANLIRDASIAESKPSPPVARPDFYSTSIEPVFRAQCLTCHTPDKKRGGLDMTTREALLKGGDTGPALIPGDPDNSLIMQLVRHEKKPHMPHKEAKLPDTAIAAIADWIRSGAQFPALVSSPGSPAKKELVITEADRAFWSFQPLMNPSVPEVQNAEWVRSPIDRFILAKLEQTKIAPAPGAGRHTLIRRLYFDMLGLPPTPFQVQSFINDTAPDAYERLIDRLLADPAYGERWGRHWLDVARYADSDGYEFDVERPTAYHYRDFVIQAFNSDMPFNDFVRWQIAGDEYSPDNPLAIAATGFCTNGPIIDNQVLELNRYDELDDIVSTTCTAFLGMTAACARCHDHKYEPIPQRDYYRMVAIFNSTKRNNAVLASRPVAQAFRQKLDEWNGQLGEARKKRDEFIGPLRSAIQRKQIEALSATPEEKALLLAPRDPNNMAQVMLRKRFESQLSESDDAVRAELDKDQLRQWSDFDKAIAGIERQKPTGPPTALSLTDVKPEPQESFLLDRGDPEHKREKVTAGFLSVLPGNDAPTFAAATFKKPETPTTYQRTALAEWLTDVQHGAGALTARVIVNRLWHYHFGQGIVRTPNDFGMQGDRPSHPELLDWLAQELIRSGWSLKHMHRLILSSAVYRQSADADAAKLAADPENRLFWRRVPQRVEAEILRDAMLSVSGCLNSGMFGPAILPYVHEDAIATHTNPLWPVGVVDGPDTWRRSVYAQVRRSARMPMMEVFDSPDSVGSCARRMTTTVPSQALELLNGKFVNDQAVHFAARTEGEGGNDATAFVTCAYQLAVSRSPRESEIRAGKQFLLDQAARHMLEGASVHAAQRAAHADFCQVLFNLNEFVYID